MNVLDKIRWLTDKKNGMGIPMIVIGRYIGCHPTTINYYLDGAIPKEKVLERYEEGINQLYNDVKAVMEG